MTRRLILMRHAKSDWDDPLADDHDRVLNGRGRRSAAALGDWLRGKGYLPDQVLCSSAMRTRETYAGLGLNLPPELRRDLYLAEASQIMGALHRASGQCVLLLAHNHGIGEFAERAVQQPPDHPRFASYPTGATLVADFDIPEWSAADWHQARSVDFIVPRDLTD